MAVNKVVMNTENGEKVLMDLTADTVTPNKLPKGVTAHDASGNPISGVAHAESSRQTFTPRSTPIYVGSNSYSLIDGKLVSNSDPYYFEHGFEIMGDSNLVPENIASGVSIFGVEGTLEQNASGGGGDGPDAVFGVSIITYDGYPYGEEYIPFKTGMTWREFCYSSLNGFVSNPETGQPAYTKIYDYDEPEVQYRFCSNAYGYGMVDYVNIHTADGNLVAWDDVIQPYVMDDPSTIYMAYW